MNLAISYWSAGTTYGSSYVQGCRASRPTKKNGTFSQHDAGTRSGGQLSAMVNGIIAEECPLIVTLEDEADIASYAALGHTPAK